MCGIAGIINFHNKITNDEHILKDMLKTLAKRGPDAEGSFKNNNVLLGHRRLIVVDPKGGKQPMTKKINNNKYTLVYNGELYNTEDLRRELIKEGYSFDSYSDTEVLLTSYICWGVDCVSKFNGIFAFAIYDEKQKIILLARDAMGVKPLFYTAFENYFIFASELKALFAHPNIDPIVDEIGLTELFSVGPALTPGTSVYKDIFEIKPGHFAIITSDGIKTKQYWQIEAKENTETLSETIEHTTELLTDAISRQLVGDVPLCTFLSGGLDSSAISALAANEYKKKNKRLTTYSIDYEDNDKYFKASLFQPTSDQYYAEMMAKYINSNHKTVIINNYDLVNSLKEAVIARDLPGMVDVDSSLLLFCKEVKKDYVIALSGECADEIFGGYPWFTREELYNSNTFPWSRFLDNRVNILNPNLKSLKIKEYANTVYLDTLKEVPHLPDESPFEYKMKEIYYLNLRWFMVNLLTRKDRMSMANSLEVRVPFADYRIVEYAFNLTNKTKLLDGREKGLLRKSLEGILPADIINRKKSPYPKTHNPIYTDLVCSAMREILDDKSSPILELIDEKVVRNIVDTKGASYTTPWYGQLMSGPQMIAYFIQMNSWLQEYGVKISL